MLRLFSLLLISVCAWAETPPVTGAVVSVDLKVMCTPGYSATVRPPVAYTNKIKTRLAAKMKVNPKDYELDHLVPISIGGDPRSLNNLWMQSWPDARKKDVLEADLHRSVCAGRSSLGYAQKRMMAWK